MVTAEQLRDLYTQARRDKVLSVFLDTDAATGLWGKKLYALERSLDQAAATLKPGEARQFAEDRDKLEAFLTPYKAHGKGLAVFSSASHGLWLAEEFRVPLQDRVRYRTGPALAPLVSLLDEYQRFGIALVDNQQARLLVAQMGEIELHEEVHDRVPKRHSQTEHAARVEYRHAKYVQDHLEHVASELDRVRQRLPFRRLVLGGAAEALPKFERLLPKALADLVIGRVSAPFYASDSELLEEGMKVAAAFERRKEGATVEELLTRGAKRQKAVLGADETLLALRERQVFELVVAAGPQVPGCACDACGMASPTVTHACPVCGGPMGREDDLVERAVGLAVLAGARVEVVCGPAKEKLRDAGSMGALLADRAFKT